MSDARALLERAPWFLRVKNTTGEWGKWFEVDYSSVESMRKHATLPIYEARQFVPIDAYLSTPAPAPKRQYFYRVDDCTARDSKSPACICWHDIGAGPLAGREATATDWRDAPASAAPAEKVRPRITLELPQDDPRTAKVHWVDRTEDGLHVCISVSESAAPAAPKPLTEEKYPDTELLDFLAEEYLDVSAFAMPTGQGDADVGWTLHQHHMGKKGRVEVACHYSDDLRAAIREAMKALGYGITAAATKGEVGNG